MPAIEAAEAEVATHTAALADSALYARGHNAVADVQRALEAARTRAATLTARWEQLEQLKDT